MKAVCRARAVMVLHGKEIAQAYMAKRLIGREELFRSKFPEHVKKRKYLIRVLREAGLNQIEIARVMGRSPSSIRYWINPEYRERRLAAQNMRLRRIAEEARA
jgi:hypothetical protein